MNGKVIPIVAPAAPRCFSSRDQWTEYLASAQAHHKADRRPFQGEHYRPTFQFCKDCDALHKVHMEQEGRCDFEGYVARVLAQQEEQHAATAV